MPCRWFLGRMSCQVFEGWAVQYVTSFYSDLYFKSARFRCLALAVVILITVCRTMQCFYWSNNFYGILCTSKFHTCGCLEMCQVSRTGMAWAGFAFVCAKSLRLWIYGIRYRGMGEGVLWWWMGYDIVPCPNIHDYDILCVVVRGDGFGFDVYHRIYLYDWRMVATGMCVPSYGWYFVGTCSWAWWAAGFAGWYIQEMLRWRGGSGNSNSRLAMQCIFCWTCIRRWWMDVFEVCRRAGVSRWQRPMCRPRWLKISLWIVLAMDPDCMLMVE